MANEISVTTGIQVANSSSRRPSNQLSKNFDQAAVGIAEITVAVTTSDQSVTLPLSTPGWMQLRNDGSNPIQWGPDNGGAILVVGEISAGATHQIEVPSGATTIRIKTTTGTSVLSMVLVRR
jgi:hypothetical protein